MSAVLPPTPPLNPSAPRLHAGPLDWRKLVQWLSEDGIISPLDAQRTMARCAQVQSAQHPIVRLASIGMTRVAGGKPLDAETISQYLVSRQASKACSLQSEAYRQFSDDTTLVKMDDG